MLGWIGRIIKESTTNGLYLAQQTQGRSRDHLHTYLRYLLNRVIPSVECPERSQSLSGSKPHLQVVGKPRSPQSELLRMVSLQFSLVLVVQPFRLPAEVVYEVCPQRNDVKNRLLDPEFFHNCR